MNVSKIVKVAGTFAGPVLSGILTVSSELEKQRLQKTVKDLVKRVSELEKK